MAGYKVVILSPAEKQFSKLNKVSAKIITDWIAKHLEGIDNPRRFGKQLKGNLSQFWGYRIGDYRLVTKIQDKEILILIFEVAHRKEVYKLVEHLLKGRKG